MFSRAIQLLAFLLAAALWSASAPAARPSSEAMVSDCEIGVRGGRLVFTQRSEPKTLHPVFAVDGPSREIIRLMTADLIHINRLSQRTEPALAKSWAVSKDGRRYTLQLRKGVAFSDGHPMDADDVIFTFQVYLDEKLHSPQRDLLLVDGKPVAVSKAGSHVLHFDLPQPYAAAERLFDSIAILPRHLLETAYREGKLAQTWGLTTHPASIAGLGPFRLKSYQPGERIVLERNPHYWKMDRKGNRLPYLDELVVLSAASEDAQVIRFQAGDADVISRMGAENFAVLEREQKARGYRLFDLGPGLEYSFLFFNLNTLEGRALPEIARKQSWFRQKAFRQAVSAAADRSAMVRLAYRRRATPIWGHVTPGNKLWLNRELPSPERSLERARKLLSSAGFRWRTDGALLDPQGSPVEFSIATSAGNAQRLQLATILQADLGELGMKVHVATLEFRSLLDRVLKTYDYEACVLGLGSGDADPNPEMNVLLSSGSSHLWRPGQKSPATEWEAEIDRLMRQQLSAVDRAERKRLYDRVQQILADQLPLIYLVSPNILAGAKETLGNFRPAILDPYAVWNVEELFWRK
jgi:peptide/nickel transport system substrate-binding protein